MTSRSTLADRISAAVRASYVGAGFRQQAPQYDPLSGEGARLHGGRFNPQDSFPVRYLCSTSACAVAELRRAAERHPIGISGFLPRTLYRYEIELTSVLDLTDPSTLDHLGVSPEQLVDDDRTVTRQIGEISHQFGYQAVLSASATGVDTVLAVFIECGADGSTSRSRRSGRPSTTSHPSWPTRAADDGTIGATDTCVQPTRPSVLISMDVDGVGQSVHESVRQCDDDSSCPAFRRDVVGFFREASHGRAGIAALGFAGGARVGATLAFGAGSGVGGEAAAELGDVK